MGRVLIRQFGTERHFGDQLASQVRQKRSSVCVGIDPRWDSLPQVIRAGIDPGDLRCVAEATGKYCRMVIEAVAEAVPVIKPQAAFFEQLGPHGMSVLLDVVQSARRAGMLVLMDGKRGDIGTTAEAYATGFLGASSPWACDALTVNPFLGEDTVMPFLKTAADRGAGIFVLVKTSNPGSGFLQDLEVDGLPVYRRIAEFVQRSCADSLGAAGYGYCGAVVGATYPEQLAELREVMPNAWLLIPGYGAQGGSASDALAGYDQHGLGAIVNSSRGIIFAYQQADYRHLEWQEAVAQAARDMRDQLPRPA